MIFALFIVIEEGARSSLKPQSSASTSSVEEVTYLKQRLQEIGRKIKVID